MLLRIGQPLATATKDKPGFSHSRSKSAIALALPYLRQETPREDRARPFGSVSGRIHYVDANLHRSVAG